MAPNISQIVQEMVGELQPLPQNDEKITKKKDPKVIVISEALPSIENSEALLPKIPIPPKSSLKPNMSFKAMTAMAIQNLPKEKGTMAQIFNWIRKNFPYYQKIPPGKWTDDFSNALKTGNEFRLVSNDIRYQKTSGGVKKPVKESMVYEIHPKFKASKEFLELGKKVIPPPKHNPASKEEVIPKKPASEVVAVPKTPAKIEVKETSFKCDQCDQSFKCIIDLNDHILQLHTPVRCEKCKIVYMNNKWLENHACKNKNNDSDEKTKKDDEDQNTTFKCEKCDSSFASQIVLNGHKSKCQMVKCQDCNALFANQKWFDSHSCGSKSGGVTAKISGTKCHQCDLNFANNYLLNMHLSKCPNKSKKRKSSTTADLEEEIPRQIKIQMLECKICKASVSSTNYDKHYKSCQSVQHYVTSNPITCIVCDLTFDSTQEVFRHVKQEHGLDESGDDEGRKIFLYMYILKCFDFTKNIIF